MKYTFNSIAGYDVEKRELEALCDTLNNKEKIEQKGGRIPKGLILYGAPGNGKTLFAKVLAEKCKLRVINIDLGECNSTVQVSKKINDAFAEARFQTEAVMIFFDELDKVLPNDYEEYYTEGSKMILTQLLTQIDGLNSKQNVFFVATCNYYPSMPRALVRAGRIDRKISIGNPTYSSRVEILKHYMRKSKCKTNISLDELARLTNGMTCAELEMLVNECVLSSDEKNFTADRIVKSKIAEINGEDIERRDSALTSLIFGCRNVGCFVVSRCFNNGGYVLSLDRDTVCNNFFNKLLSDYDSDYDCDDEEEDDDETSNFFSSQDLKNAITVIYGGYIAQELILGDVYDNVRSQLNIVDDIIDGIVGSGMLGIINRYVHSRIVPYTPERIEEISKEIENMLENCYLSAKEIVTQNQELIKELIPILVERKSITQKECERILSIKGK